MKNTHNVTDIIIHSIKVSSLITGLICSSLLLIVFISNISNLHGAALSNLHMWIIPVATWWTLGFLASFIYLRKNPQYLPNAED